MRDQEPSVCIKKLLYSLPENNRIVILIDEYDCQLTANINHPERYEKFLTCIRELYAVIKGDRHIRFLGVTGVTRLKDVSIFSVGSDIEDLSYDNSCAQLIGFTRDEIRKFYPDYLRLGVAYEKKKPENEVTEDETEDLLDRIAEHYDGYSFDELNKNKVFSTYSVNKFFCPYSKKKKLYLATTGTMQEAFLQFLDTIWKHTSWMLKNC